jgi:cytochrome P450
MRDVATLRRNTGAFIPPRPPPPGDEPNWYRFLVGIRTNALQMWPQRAYEEEVVAGWFLGRRRFLLSAPQAIHRVLVENTSNYARTAATIRILGPIVGDGLLLAEGEAWRHQRRIIAPALAPRVMPMLARHVAAAAQELIVRLATGAQVGAGGGTCENLDLLSAMQFLTLEIAARTMFSLEMQRYGAALRRLIEQFAVRLGRPYFLDVFLPPAIPTWHDLARRRFRSHWVALMDEIVESRLAAADRQVKDNPADLFDMLLAARDPETGAAFSREQLRDQMATLMVAGHETTALTLFWAIYLLANAPTEQQRLAEEVRTLNLRPEAVADELPRLSFTRAVINEALRLFPPAFAIARIAKGEDVAGGIAIPKGALIMMSPWVLHHHVRLWDRPDEFIPSRFLSDSAAPPRFAFLPFGVGPRVCVGAQFALTEASLVLAMLIQRFEIAPADDRPVLPVAVVTTRPDHPAHFRLTPRK